MPRKTDLSAVPRRAAARPRAKLPRQSSAAKPLRHPEEKSSTQQQSGTEREELARELEQPIHLLDAILSTTPDHFHVHDRAGHYLYASPIALQAIGLTADRVVGKTWRDLDFPAAEGLKFDERLERVFESGQPVTAELRLSTPDGPRFYEQILSPIRDDAGRVSMAVSTMHDITDRKRGEAALSQYAAELQVRNEELEVFAHMVAHDLKSPLSNIIGSSDWLQARPGLPTDEQLAYLTIIARNAVKIDNIVDELLLLAQVRKADVERTPSDMGRIVAEAQTRLSFMIKEFRPEIHLPASWPAALGYAPWIEEVWVNYLSNAIKYGGTPARIELGSDTLPDSHVRFWVRDNGPGIAPDEQAKLFTAFGENVKVRATGYGLGLSIVRHIVEKMGGQVGVESDGVPGQGSTFSFTLPAAP